MSIKTRETLHVLQVKISAGKASSGAVLQFSPCSARLQTRACFVEWKIGWLMPENVVYCAYRHDFGKRILAGPNQNAVLCNTLYLKPLSMPWCKKVT